MMDDWQRISQSGPQKCGIICFIPQKSVREQTHHIILVRRQVDRFVNNYGEVVSEIPPVA